MLFIVKNPNSNCSLKRF